MSQDVKQKKQRIGSINIPTVEFKEESVRDSKETKRWENANVSLEEFDWDEHAAGCPSQMRKGNPYVKTPSGTKIFYQGADAQKWFDLYEGVTANFKVVVELGEHIVGTIYSITDKWATIDVGHRELVYIDLDKESNAIRSLIKPGKEFTVRITGKKEDRGFILGSITEGTRQAIVKELQKSIETGTTAYTGTVTQMIPGGGYIVNIQGVDCFMPGSLAGANKLADFESIIGTEMYVCPVSYSYEKGTVVVSHRKYLQALVPNEVEKLRNAERGTVLTGNITGSAKFGVFVEFLGCLTGMIHINDLNEEFAGKLANDQIEPGAEITFMIKEIINDKKITLTQKEEVEVQNPWDGIMERYVVPAKIQGTVKAVKDYGIFVTIEEGIVGLLHVSELADIDISTIKKGDPISVTITRIDESSRKVFLQLL